MSGLDIFLGDPIYDDQYRVVGREFGVKNVIAIAVVLYVGNVMMGQMKPKSGGGKMKGGGNNKPWLIFFFVMAVIWGSIMFVPELKKFSRFPGMVLPILISLFATGATLNTTIKNR